MEKHQRHGFVCLVGVEDSLNNEMDGMQNKSAV